MFKEVIYYENHEPRNQALVQRTQEALLAKIATAHTVSYLELVCLPLDDNTRVPYDITDTALAHLVDNGLVVKSHEPTDEGSTLITYELHASTTIQ